MEDNLTLLKEITLLQGLIKNTSNTESSIEHLHSMITGQSKEIKTIKGKITENKKDEVLKLLEEQKAVLTAKLFKQKCEKHWGDLIHTEKNNVRFCTDCMKNVYYVDNEQEFINRKQSNHCIAINIATYKPTENLTSNSSSCLIEYEDDLLGLPF